MPTEWKRGRGAEQVLVKGVKGGRNESGGEEAYSSILEHVWDTSADGVHTHVDLCGERLRQFESSGDLLKLKKLI